MDMAKIVLAGAASVALIASLGTEASAGMMPPPMGQMGARATSYGFFPAPIPPSGNRAGLWVATRATNGVTSLYYCSTPVDSTTNGASVCKKMNGLPSAPITPP